MHPLGAPDMYCAGELILRAAARLPAGGLGSPAAATDFTAAGVPSTRLVRALRVTLTVGRQIDLMRRA